MEKGHPGCVERRGHAKATRTLRRKRDDRLCVGCGGCQETEVVGRIVGRWDGGGREGASQRGGDSETQSTQEARQGVGVGNGEPRTGVGQQTTAAGMGWVTQRCAQSRLERVRQGARSGDGGERGANGQRVAGGGALQKTPKQQNRKGEREGGGSGGLQRPEDRISLKRRLDWQMAQGRGSEGPVGGRGLGGDTGLQKQRPAPVRRPCTAGRRSGRRGSHMQFLSYLA